MSRGAVVKQFPPMTFDEWAEARNEYEIRLIALPREKQVEQMRSETRTVRLAVARRDYRKLSRMMRSGVIVPAAGPGANQEQRALLARAVKWKPWYGTLSSIGLPGER